MKITIVGSGTVFLDDGRCQSCVVVEAGGETIVMDLGSGATKGMMHCGLDRFRVDRVFFTHFHADHTSDLIPFLDTMNYSSSDPRTRPLHIYGPHPFTEFWNSIPNVWMDGMSPKSHPLEVVELPTVCESPLRLPGCTVRWAKAKHRPESISYRLESNGNSFVYTGDTEYCESVTELAKGADTLLMECSCPDDSPMPGHMTPASVAKVASEADVGRLVLTHVFPATRKTDLVGEIGRVFTGEILLAEDGMKLDV